MAMPSSGCISLRDCISGCACSSISCAVAGTACSPACLSSLSVQAGKSSPHCMREFYGYFPKYLSASPTDITFRSLGGTCQVCVTSNVGWSVSESLSWITASCTSSGNDTFLICADSGFVSRSGIVCVVGLDVPVVCICVCQ